MNGLKYFFINDFYVTFCISNFVLTVLLLLWD